MNETLAPLAAFNQTLVTEALARLVLPRLTIDVDGSVGPYRHEGRLGLHVAFTRTTGGIRATIRFCPPGPILRLQNRPGNAYDSKQPVPVCTR